MRITVAASAARDVAVECSAVEFALGDDSFLLHVGGNVHWPGFHANRPHREYRDS
jgi:hypothetical protein